ncbi:hypothetical protein AVEN_32976-1 [Araneus ventricosus]|uniref:Uncharacterized protein n=1 Tax=Araneus ventricosus TaxID=182803 RepID=A0A4Y2INT3_ARAVE|nr:hypothetical protein AVEN_32976-1 [Araneus ventricosus]
MSDDNARRCLISGRKGAKFSWTIPNVLRKYMDSAKCYNAMHSKPVLNSYFEEITGQKDFRVPSAFRGSIGRYPTGLPIFIQTSVTPEERHSPLKILIRTRCFANVTFRARTYNYS